MSDYTFKLWSEENFDVGITSFSLDAYRLKKYAFVSDVARLYALHCYGGIYLDTDMLVFRSFDDLLTEDAFIGKEAADSLSAGIIGACPNNSIIKVLLDGYAGVTFDVSSAYTIPGHFNRLIGIGQDKVGLKVYEPKYFYALPFDKRDHNYENYICPESYAVHLWNHSWKDEFAYLKDQHFLSSLAIFFKNLLLRPRRYWSASYIKRYSLEFKRRLKTYVYLSFHKL